mmetsp:Transcript_11521/g.19487  ORF Transcript_11521/g.19487 Transcript_11521/m.19487 type:complete len:252 (-) Transcript_11521:259-1014(-)|eukprot:CAMPEP_0168610222 /NCGR_PEP_ID=MMETSP0449_2-20121227/1665_1 /TAXON_ID=1082188 /ORGANISM="Strombidium rassoulzadegani, Strain ras09" /LENGTH=251 /DNA_ID=CAMNT_0008650499 /DNA_START=231 /DNA_END=986 /DNA_ORIENTATION=+
MKQHNSIVVARYNVGLDEEVLLALNHENALLLALFDLVVKNSGRHLARALSAESNIGLDVLEQVVGVDLCGTALLKENSLAVVLDDGVALGNLGVVDVLEHKFLELDRGLEHFVEGHEGVDIPVSYAVLEKLEVEVLQIFAVLVRPLQVQVIEEGAADVGLGVVHYANASFAVGLDDVGLDVGVALGALADNSVVGRGLYIVLLDEGAGRVSARVADDFDAVVVALLDGVLKDDGLVVDDLDAHVVDLHLV